MNSDELRFIIATPGTPEWHAHRAQHFNASEVGAMLGESPYMTREELLDLKQFGRTEDVDRFQQKRYDEGHVFEAFALKKAEDIIAEDLGPLVLARGKLSASFDGLTFTHKVSWEHKRLNDALRKALPYSGVDGLKRNNPADLPVMYQGQMEQGFLITQVTKRCLFMASLWTPDGELQDMRVCWYYPDTKLRSRIVGGWKVFAEDLVTHRRVEKKVEVQAEVVEALPALRVEIKGEVAVTDNLLEVKAKLQAYVQTLPQKPSTDQDFANLDDAVKRLEAFEKRLEAEKQRALNASPSIESFLSLVAVLDKISSDTRLGAGKLVKTRKEEIRQEQIERGRTEMANHIQALNARIGKPYMPVLAAEFTDFAGAISGVKKFDNLRGRINEKLAAAKIEANRIAEGIQVNLRYLDQHKEHASLFPDEATIVRKSAEDLEALVTSRIAQHQERERKKAAPVVAAPVASSPPPAPAQSRATAEPDPFTSPVVVSLHGSRAQPAERTLNLGTIAERLGFQLTAAFISEKLGVQGEQVRKSVMFYETDFDTICLALAQHVARVRLAKTQAAA
jgi:predicted phage-related endonuclease